MISLLYLFLYLLFIAFFSGIEIAFISSNRIAIELKKKQGSQSANLIAHYFTKPEDFISSSLIGLNIALILFGMTLQDFLHFLLQGTFFNEDTHPFIVLLLELLISTIIIFFFGEFLPKSIFKSKNNTLLILFAPFIYVLFLVLKPITRFFVLLADFLLHKVFKLKYTHRVNTTSFKYIDLEPYIEEKTSAYADTEDIQNKLLRNVLQFTKIPVGECLLPKPSIISVDMHANIEDVLKKFIDFKVSRLIVYKNNLNHIVGYIHHLDLFKKPRTIKSILIPIPIFAETTKINRVLKQLSDQGKSIGLVIDEYGTTSGIITIEKLLEEVFGESHVYDEYYADKKQLEKKIDNTHFLFSGSLTLDYLKEKYGFEFPHSEVETLSGFLIVQNKEIPSKGDSIVFGAYSFLIEKVNNKTIESVLVTLLDEASE